MLLPKAFLPFFNHNDDPPQLCLNQVKNQFALWGAINMRITKFSCHILQVQWTNLKIIVGVLSLITFHGNVNK
jgi:hypothetical protein